MIKTPPKTSPSTNCWTAPKFHTTRTCEDWVSAQKATASSTTGSGQMRGSTPTMPTSCGCGRPTWTCSTSWIRTAASCTSLPTCSRAKRPSDALPPANDEDTTKCEKIVLQNGLGNMHRRKRECVIRFHRYNREKETSEMYRAKIMLYIYRGGTRLWTYWLDTQTSSPTTNTEQTPFWATNASTAQTPP